MKAEQAGNNGVSKKRQDTADRIIKALGECQGLLTMAARRAGVSYTTINRYVHDFPSVAQAVHEVDRGRVQDSHMIWLNGI